MKSLKEHFIVEVAREAVARTPVGQRLRILDLGCGTAQYVAALLEQFPTIEYVGVEPIALSFAAAKANLAQVEHATVHFQLGYDGIENETKASFDLVFSLSVLEHIKQLDRFISLGAMYAKKGGLVVHRYDLGHALHTHSFKERVHVWLGNTIPAILPERQFVRYVPEAEVRSIYHAQNISVLKTTYHQMPSHKKLEKYFKNKEGTLVQELFAWEMRHQDSFMTIPQEAREYLFPAVAVWGEKQ